MTVEALGHIGSNNALDPLLQMVPMADRDMRYVIARSFGLIGDTRAKSVLTRFLGDEDCDVVREAARSLAELERKQQLVHYFRKSRRLTQTHSE